MSDSIYAIFKKTKGVNETKTYYTTVSVSDASKVNWDDTNDGMNDVMSSVTTGPGKWVQIYSANNFDESSANLIVPESSTDYDLSDHNFSARTASFKVLDYDPSV